MDFKEVYEGYDIRDEINHWWNCTRYLYIQQVIQIFKQNYSYTHNYRILEYGCGTGQNLYYISNISNYKEDQFELVGIDKILKCKISPDWLNGKGSLSNHFNPKESGNVQLILAMDIIEHIEDDEKILSEFYDYLDSGGLILVTVPAFNHLWSYHDEYLGHKRRYNKKDLIDVMMQAGFKAIRVHYIFSYIYPIVLFIRKIFKRNKKPSSDFQMSSSFLNRLLKLLGKLEYYVRGSNYFGTSIIGVFSKK